MTNGFAIFDSSKEYRYFLSRDTSGTRTEISSPDDTVDGETLLAIMLNPSTADADLNDMTISKLSSFSIHHGFDRLEVVNLFALRSTNPEVARFV